MSARPLLGYQLHYHVSLLADSPGILHTILVSLPTSGTTTYSLNQLRTPTWQQKCAPSRCVTFHMANSPVGKVAQLTLSNTCPLGAYPVPIRTALPISTGHLIRCTASRPLTHWDYLPHGGMMIQATIGTSLTSEKIINMPVETRF
uniref:ARAD1B17336p n=1 Tax=Blastobotrys adeninivorans TaxID=409370 RepID=A0A060T689_BLAAD